MPLPPFDPAPLQPSLTLSAPAPQRPSEAMPFPLAGNGVGPTLVPPRVCGCPSVSRGASVSCVCVRRDRSGARGAVGRSGGSLVRRDSSRAISGGVL
eukprot:2819706-Prymnesium_polylepis.1